MFQFIEQHPISAFLKVCFREKEALDILSKLEIENELIEKIILNIFYDMGIFYVYPGQNHEILKHAVITFLKNSPEIRQMENKLKHEATLRKNKGIKKA